MFDLLAVLWERCSAEARYWRARQLEAFALEAEMARDREIKAWTQSS